jgi:hypothetical protein
MITCAVNDEFIDLNDSTSFTLSGDSPFIDPGEIPGIKVYNISALITPRNQKIFGFSEKLNNIQRGQEFANVKIYLYNLLWKVGTFKLRSTGSSGYQFSFHTDAGDIQLKIKNRKLSELDLGTVANDFNHTDIYPVKNHVFFTVKNLDLYGNKNVDYDGYINLWNNAAGRFYNNNVDGGGVNKYTVMPFPYLLFVLDGIFKDVGYYGMEGDWIDDADIKRVCIVGNYAMDEVSAGVNVYQTDITYSRHLPADKIGSFLIDVCIFFGITFKINPVTKMVQVIKIKDWLNNVNYLDYNSKAKKQYGIDPNDYDGVKFTMDADSKDDTLEDLPDWLEYQEGNGQLEVKVDASPLSMITENHPITSGAWTIPEVFQKGQSLEFDMNNKSKSGIRFMIFNGMVNDGSGAAYPQGHYIKSGFSLRWDGTDGIINRCYREWIDWKTYTEKVEREVALNIVEMLQLDPENKIMINNLKYVVANYSGTIGFKEGLRSVKLSTYSVKL